MNLPDNVREVLEIRQEMGQASVKKYKAMDSFRGDEDRVRSTTIFGGATRTLRWSGSGIQPHNYVKGKIKDVDEIAKCVKAIEEKDMDFLTAHKLGTSKVLSSCLRAMICAAYGYDFICADYANIESRGVLWLAGDDDSLEIFRLNDLDPKKHPDIYRVMAASIYNVEPLDVTEEQRFVGKIAILGLGYGMGWDRFYNTCQDWGAKWVTVRDAKRIVALYRTMYASIPKLWRTIEKAAKRAILRRCKVKVDVGPELYFSWRDSLTGGSLVCTLPSGREMVYQKVSLKKYYVWVFEESIIVNDKELEYSVEIKTHRFRTEKNECPGARQGVNPGWELKNSYESTEIRYWGQDSKTHKWAKQYTWGGKLVENIVQAFCRDLLANGMLNLEKAGYPIVMTVHDEIIAEVKKGFGSLEEFEKLICVLPDWAKGCPIAAEGWRGAFYRKG
jgi:DNA polymerase